MNKQVCIVVSVYKTEITPTEKISLTRLNKLCCKKYDIYLISPEDLDVTGYEKLMNVKETKRYNNDYFKSQETYSQLLVQSSFYEGFSDYEYMLVYQPDCYLFRDEIVEWCKKGYDYIGAPIISNNSGWPTFKKNPRHEPLVGNGGLSLRKIETFIYLFDPEGEIRKTYNLDDKIWSTIKFEDLTICDELTKFYDLDMPTWREAAKFSWDMNPDSLYDLYGMKEMPMGCHAVEKNMLFWKDHVPEYTDEIVEWCKEKFKKFYDVYYDENGKSYRLQK